MPQVSNIDYCKIEEGSRGMTVRCDSDESTYLPRKRRCSTMIISYFGGC